MNDPANGHAHIKGWGIDADPKNDPTYPMRTRSGDEHEGRGWQRPTRQPVDIEVLQSIERPDVTAVFGTAAPPSGLSGMIRRLAFSKSENAYAHWLPLILADRVNVVEGIVDDLVRGKVPNLFMEKGLNADWKHDRARLLTKMALGAAVVVGAAVYLSRKNRRG